MYEVLQYEEVNIRGTANLIDFLTNDRSSVVENVVVASSRAVYGEGRYDCVEHGVVFPGTRDVVQMRQGRFEPLCPTCGGDCRALPTGEATPFNPTSFYGLTKQVQEQMVLMYARSLGLQATALRYQNVYGPGQSLKNPYTGILAIFSTLARQGKTISIFEDGAESRDFVHVEDVVEATWLALKRPAGAPQALNVGSGIPTSVLDVATVVAAIIGGTSAIEVTGEFRVGDIRHNFADLTAVRETLGFEPKVDFDTGIRSFLDWAYGEPVEDIGFDASIEALQKSGLFHRRESPGAA